MSVYEKIEGRLGDLRVIEQRDVPGVVISVATPTMFSRSGHVHGPQMAQAFLPDTTATALVEALEKALRNIRRAEQ